MERYHLISLVPVPFVSDVNGLQCKAKQLETNRWSARQASRAMLKASYPTRSI